MSADWPLVSIEDIKADSKGSIAIGPFGSRMKSDCYVEEGVPVIRGTNITGGPTFEGNFVYITKEKAETLGSSNVYQHDLVFPHRGSIGEVGIILDDEHYVISSSLMKLTCDTKRVNPKYIYYFFKSRLGRHELLKNASQVGTPGIGQPLSSLKSIEFRLPPIEVQNSIEKMITSLDEKIELNRETNQTLEHIAQAIFKSWFVDFEPTRVKIAAKQAGQDPERAAMAAISGKSLEELDQINPEQQEQLKTTAALFPDTLVDSELGDIPEGWVYKEAIDVAGVAIGKTPPRKESQWFSEDQADVRWVSIRDMGESGAYIQDTNEYLTEEAINKFNVRRIPDDTVILSFKMTVGRVAITDGEMLSNEAIAHFKLGEVASLSTEYLYLYLTSFDFESLGSTSSIATAVNSKMIKNMPLLVPSNEVLNHFSSCINSIFQQIKTLLSETRDLTDIRDALLPQLLSGELPAENEVA